MRSDPFQDHLLDPDPVIEEYKKHLDLSLIRENLKLSVTERFEKLERMLAFAAEIRAAGQRARESR